MVNPKTLVLNYSKAIIIYNFALKQNYICQFHLPLFEIFE